MPGKLLIVDSIATNRIVLKVRLSGAFYEVSQAATLQEAETLLKHDKPDMILINEQLSDGDALGFITDLRAAPQTRDLPIVVLAAMENRVTRIAALRAGANAVLARPIDDLVLLARLRSLLRDRETREEYQLRERTKETFGLAETADPFAKRPSVMLVVPEKPLGVRWQSQLKALSPYQISCQKQESVLQKLASDSAPDVFVIAIDPSQPAPALRLLAEIRARATSRYSGILMVMLAPDRQVMIDALDLGAQDIMPDGFDTEEITLRLATLVAQKRYSDRLRNTVTHGLQAALTDPLTGLFNRRYALPHLSRIAQQAQDRGRFFAVLIADIDHFKSVNDRFGHAAGDVVLTETAQRLRNSLRAVDLLARIGGEEFLIALPDVSQKDAAQTARRLCAALRDSPIEICASNAKVPVTISIGASLGGGTLARSTDEIMKEADQALYAAKTAGRDRVLFASLPA
ncbi:diguanylate cyclase [Cognatishimia sp. SS12]|uniref:diguanylate cyclase n=1 Tax=Cognatishimia sp. SS12 TaxID=2979465 RepID=UPI00232FA31E|nr:diguanylate cyclase [Cognatishimia sp. SS12]MDC0736689.1 diguanylate cyclase [Cognatishimia sp. SS12]